jgi:hypothetical protein
MGWDELSTEQRHAHWRETARQMRALMQAVGGVLSKAELEAYVDRPGSSGSGQAAVGKLAAGLSWSEPA